jgi:hypothetical protein
VVTADGRFLKASESEYEDLFWGLRGGGNFGIVTSFEYRLYPVGPFVLGGMLLYPFDKAAERLSFWRDYVETAPDELGSAPAFVTAPPAPFVPEHTKGQIVAGLIICYAGPPEEGEEWVRSLRELGPEVDLVQPMPYTVVQTLLDPGNSPGRNNYWKAENLSELGGEAIDTIVAHASQMTAPFSQVVIQPMGVRSAVWKKTRSLLAAGTRPTPFTRSLCGRIWRSRTRISPEPARFWRRWSPLPLRASPELHQRPERR